MEYIIYEDPNILVCQKPSGLAVQNASFGRKDLESILKTYLFEKEGKTNPYLGIVHRLDQPVQGLVVFAKNPQSAAALSAQVQDGRMKKYYRAVTCGIPKESEGRLIHYLKKNGKTNLSQVVGEKTPGAKKAELFYRVLETKEGQALVEIELFTGRHHQIRVQMAANKTPLYGDQKYNQNAQKGQQIALCACRQELQHPVTGKHMTFECKPEDGAFALFSGEDHTV